MRLGIYVGSFDPVHLGHINIVNYLIDNNYVDKVLIIPTLNYWDKNINASLVDRINMLKYFETDKIIVDTTHNSYIYTYELLNVLNNEYRNDLYLIIGADNIINLHKWKNYDDLLKYKMIIIPRNNIDINKYKKDNMIVLENYREIDVSSSDIRSDLDNNYLDKRVLKYIKKHKLYMI